MTNEEAFNNWFDDFHIEEPPNYQQLRDFAFAGWEARLAYMQEKCEPVAECLICATGNDLPEGEYCRACGRENNMNDLGRAIKYARGGNSVPTKPLLYTSPQPRDWVGLSDDIDVEKLALGSGVHKSCGVSQYFRKDFVIKHTSKEQFFYRLKHFAESYLEAKCKQLNTKG